MGAKAETLAYWPGHLSAQINAPGRGSFERRRDGENRSAMKKAHPNFLRARLTMSTHAVAHDGHVRSDGEDLLGKVLQATVMRLDGYFQRRSRASLPSGSAPAAPWSRTQTCCSACSRAPWWLSNSSRRRRQSPNSQNHPQSAHPAARYLMVRVAAKEYRRHEVQQGEASLCPWQTWADKGNVVFGAILLCASLCDDVLFCASQTREVVQHRHFFLVGLRGDRRRD